MPATYQTSPLAQARAPTLISAAGLLCFRRASQSEGRPSSVRSCPPWLAPACAPCLLACCPRSCLAPSSLAPCLLPLSSGSVCLLAQFSFLFMYPLFHSSTYSLYCISSFTHSLTHSVTHSVYLSVQHRGSDSGWLPAGACTLATIFSTALQYFTSLNSTPLDLLRGRHPVPVVCWSVDILICFSDP